MSYMAEVAKMLGVELGQQFKVEEVGHHHETLYRLEADGAWDEDDEIADDIIPALLTGTYKIVKEPWKPSLLMDYWHPDIRCGWKLAAKKQWVEDNEDYFFYHIGMCYETADEAMKHLEEDCAVIKHFERFDK